jgi:F0F1-type ATP synthase assembly protein I
MNQEQKPADHEPTKPAGAPMLGAGLAIGLAIGVAIGVAMDNIALGIPIGLAIGIAFGAAFQARKPGADEQGDNTSAGPAEHE